MTSRVRLVTLLLATFGLFACGGEGDSAPPPINNETDTVLMIVLEGASPEELGQLALQQNLMPALGKLARESTWFNRHWTQSNSTNAAFGSLLTGLYSSRHGLGSPTRVGHESLSSAVTLISEDLSEAGFDCLASVSTRLFSAEFSGFEQGWSKFECGNLLADGKSRSAKEVLDAAWTDFDSKLSDSERVFGLFEFSDPRMPELTPERYVASALVQHLAPFEDEFPQVSGPLDKFRGGATEGVEPLRKLFARRRGHPVHAALEAAYRQAQFVYLDEQLSRLFGLLAKHERYRDALIVVTGNQGTSSGRYMGSEGDFGIFQLSRMHTPLLIRLPGGQGTRAVHALTQAIDVRATVTDALGLACPDSDGVSLLPLLVEQFVAEPPHACVVFEDSLLGSVAAVDDFWFVQNGGDSPYMPLDEAGAELHGREIPPVPKAMLQRTRTALSEFVGPAQVAVRSAAGASPQYTLKVSGIEGYWIDGRLVGDGAQEVSSQPGALDRASWGRRVGAGAHVTLQASAEESGAAGFDLWSEAEPASFVVALQASEGELDESKVRFGDRELSRLALPRVPDQQALAWPVDGEGVALPAIVEVTRESGRWLKVRVGGEPGQKVSLLLAGEPRSASDWSELKLRQSGQNKTHPVAGRPDCVWVDGETPMSLSFKAHSTYGVGLSVALEGVQVPVRDMKYIGNRFAAPGAIKLAVMSWLPGVREHLELASGTPPRTPEPGTLWFGCRAKRRFANDREIPRPEILDRIQRLRDTD